MMISILFACAVLAAAETAFVANTNAADDWKYDVGKYEILSAEMPDTLKNLVLGNSRRCYTEQWSTFCSCLKSALQIARGGSWNCIASQARGLHYAASYQKNNFIHFVRGSLEIVLYKSGGGIFS